MKLTSNDKLKQLLFEFFNENKSDFISNVDSLLKEDDSLFSIEETFEYLYLICEVAVKEDFNKIKLLQNNIQKIRISIENQPGFIHFLKSVWSTPPNEVFEYINHFTDHNTFDLVKLTSFETHFWIELGAEKDDTPIYILYDLIENISQKYWDVNLNKTMPINGDSSIFDYDSYISWYQLLNKYFPNRKIILTSKKDQIPRAYLYVLNFRYFNDFFENHKNDKNFLPIRNDVLEDCINNKALIILNDAHECTDYSKVFKWFQHHLNHNMLNENVFVFSGDLANLNKYYKFSNALKFYKFIGFKNEEPINFYTIRWYEDALSAIVLNEYKNYSFEKRLKVLKSNDSKLKHFLCFNRIIKDYRVVLSYFIFKNDLLGKSYVSQAAFNSSQDYQFGHNKNFALNALLDPKIMEHFKKSLPWSVDTQDFKTNLWNHVNIDILENSFVWVVTETEFSNLPPKHRSFHSEKTYKPIAFFMPFIIVGNPGTLSILRKEGYQTFSKWWDESYDKVLNPLERMKKIQQLILEISTWEISKLIQISIEMQSVLEHNRNLLVNIKRSSVALNAVIQRYDFLSTSTH